MLLGVITAAAVTHQRPLLLLLCRIKSGSEASIGVLLQSLTFQGPTESHFFRCKWFLVLECLMVELLWFIPVRWVSTSLIYEMFICLHYYGLNSRRSR